LLLRLTTVSCASLFLVLLAVYVCSFKQDWSHTCGSYRCVEIEFCGTILAVNWLVSEGMLLRNRCAKHAVTPVFARNHQTSWTFVPAVHRLFDSRGEGKGAECLHAAVVDFHFVMKSGVLSFWVLFQWSTEVEIFRRKVQDDWNLDVARSMRSCRWWHSETYRAFSVNGL
jgi:hypothetical protein